MGYMKHKYTRAYFLKEDALGNPTRYGAEGIEDFNMPPIPFFDF